MTRPGPISSFLTCCNLFPISDYSIGSHFRAGSVINEGPTEEPLSPPIYTSKAVTYKGLKQNSEGPFICSFNKGLHLLSVDEKLRQPFSPRTVSFPPIWNLSPVPILFPWKPLILMLPNCPSQSPAHPLGVGEDWGELQVQSGTKIKSGSLRSRGMAQR